ncbi:class I SAM-dependent methyltransferase [uncultured Photobacterium sp.]|uniref:class I SAM-dependent methyltransferase n=1 Tax=uncultured Photobacterium sp. TaxID=173973 RepID=UPI0026296DD5|nr:class I SAM-dependent methyltransferase [uncultured Photobacterium sp.]
MSQNIHFYQRNAQRLAGDYLDVSFESVHASWKPYWLGANEQYMRVLDIGAGSGRDAKWFAELTSVMELGVRFELILVSAVWMHIPRSERKRAFRNLAKLLMPNGKLVFSLRHGIFEDGRIHHGVSTDEIDLLAKEHALHVSLKRNYLQILWGALMCSGRR